MPRLPSLLAAALLALPALLSAQEEEEIREREEAITPTPEALDTVAMPQALKARSIGPAVMGGRVADIALDPQNPYVFYVGLGTGGLMKTSDNGGTFQGMFEQQPVASIGAVAVAP